MKDFTIGYGGRKPEDFVAVLRMNEVRAVVDVRLRRDHAAIGIYAKAKSAEKGIEGLLSKAGIQYCSLPELGNIFMEHEDWPQRYAALLDRAGDLLTERLRDVPQPFCLVCAERHSAQLPAIFRQSV
ncbi:hypothetical protein FJY63_15055 [Candidatus Sumerlaeota bacterium]|nr:hypothetical protein [Candidatus Sumerlaeota bacterium]